MGPQPWISSVLQQLLCCKHLENEYPAQSI
uniref:Uncharacterized protein LOC104237266 n=1 Tax=Nicotiana sylvestris TaxID=4096 RepID=A0A1U7XT74_NICSY|nr:PREDICTED: uncharacterized protein LOC104237266 [Nicotiana sylvestris]